MAEIVEIEFVGPLGDGIATYQGHPLYIAGAVQGDVVSVDIRKSEDGQLRGNIIEWHQQGAGRIDAPCPYFNTCGGCITQHLSPEYYPEWKISSVRAVLDRAKIVPELWGDPVFIPHATRRRASFAAMRTGKEVRLGFHLPKSNDIVRIDNCIVLTPRLNEILARIGPWLAKIIKEQTLTDILLQDVDGAIDMVIVGALSRAGEADVGQRKIIADMCAELQIARVSWQKKEFAEIEPVIDLNPVVKRSGKIDVEIPAGAFLQPSREGEEALVRIVMAALPKIRKMKIADLYAGCGTFAGAALEQGTVHAVEEYPAAVTALQKVKAAGLTAEKRNLSAEPLTVRELRNYDVAIFDPPRAGAKEQAEKLAKADLKKIIAVSCNPVTFARDAGILINGGYKLRQLTLVDQFIWSQHSELVGVFSRD